MNYVSTRGQAPELGFADVLLTGLAADGGLYVPTEWPALSRDEIADFAGVPYADVAADLLGRFAGTDIAPADLRAMCIEAYARFAHPAVAPLIQIDANAWILELFHGPTFAFKDLAMQILARLMDHVLAERGRRATIVAATSGDTGGSAIEAFRGAERIDLFVLFPKGRVSQVQQRQMTTVDAPNIHAIAVEGSFDDCQALVKGLFADRKLREEIGLAAVNSINWARIAAQTAYYFTSAVALGAPARPISYCVPTGNFGDVLAGHVAAQMGLPIDRLIVATNSNDILARTLKTGRYELQAVVPTSSPAMDIQISSNFERLLWEATGRDGEAVRRAMDRLKQNGAFDVPTDALSWMRERFSADRADEAETAAAMRDILHGAAYLADPHTAVGLSVAGRVERGKSPLVTIATAHPAKFPDAVEAAIGERPVAPPAIAALADRTEQFEEISNDIAAMAAHLRAQARASLET